MDEADPMKIDFHCHCFDPALLPAAYQQALVRGHQARTGNTKPIEPIVDRMRANMNDPDGAVLRQSLEGCGIGHAFVIGLDWGLALDDPAPSLHPLKQLEWATRLKALHSDGFFSFAFGIDPRRADAAELVKHALETCAEGVKIYPPAGFRPDDEVCDSVYEQVIAADAYVITHTGRQSYPFDLEKGRVEPYASVQRRHPELKLVLAHAGVPFWGAEAIEVAKGHPKTMLEVSGWHKFLENEPDRVRDFLLRAWQELGPYKVLFGTDLVSGPGMSSRLPLLQRWVDFYEETASRAGIDTVKAAAASFQNLTVAASRRAASLV
jgi:predicted TIM-barrel fold metal-dependent hydrolase